MIVLDKVTKRFGPKILFENVSMQFDPGKRYGLTGANGAGKSTLLKMLEGNEDTDTGSITIPGNLRLGVLRQNHFEYEQERILDTVIMGNKALWSAMAEKERLLVGEVTDEVGVRLGELEGTIGEEDGYTAEGDAAELLVGLGIPADKHESKMNALSGGYKLRVLIAQVLYGKPDVLLLDEPTNHLDLESILWLEGWLRDFEGALILTTHDREFMNRIVSKIIAIDGGELTSYSGNYDFYERQRALADREQEAQYARQQAMLAKEEAFIARFKARASHASQVQSRIKKIDKIEKVEPPKRAQTLEFEVRLPPRSGDDVLRLAGIRKAYGERVIFDDFDLLIRRGERWCVMGRNGAGKTTLLKIDRKSVV